MKTVSPDQTKRLAFYGPIIDEVNLWRRGGAWKKDLVRPPESSNIKDYEF